MKGKDFWVMSYNVENLFDTINDPENDDDFTPAGKMQWNTKRYQEKLNHIAQVLTEAKNQKGQWPAVVGFIEVEHASCLQDLVALPQLKEANYEVVFREGEDERGIDVALIYRKKWATLVDVKTYPVVLPDNDKTRSILDVTLKVESELMHFIVNHWPSRSGGMEKTEPSRILAAKTLKKVGEEMEVKDQRASFILCMGDFNDHPDNVSVMNELGCSPSSKQWHNAMQEAFEAKQGSHFYKGEWGMLDQFIVNHNWFDARGWEAEKGEIMQADFLYYTSSKGEKSPSRTYVGDSYKGGYSDHLPILIHLVQRSK